MPKTLLLADDSVVIQKLVGLSFANEDVEVFTTDNGDDALRQIHELRPDLVLADVVMPGKNGYELCEAIKTDVTLSHIPVLMLTGTFEAFDEERARRVGAEGHITKPFEAQGLVERVAALLARAPAGPGMPVTASIESPPGSDFTTAPGQAREFAATETTSTHGDDVYDFFDSVADENVLDTDFDIPSGSEAPSRIPRAAPSTEFETESHPTMSLTPDPDAVMFGDDPLPEPTTLPAGLTDLSESTETDLPAELESVFEFGTESPSASQTTGDSLLGDDLLLDELDPLAGIDTASAGFGADAPNSPDRYDVSATDLGDPFGGDALASATGDTPGTTMPGASPDATLNRNATPGPEISEEMRERIHETLEKIAWEAFADVSDSVVRQVVARVESIAWEIVPQMAEALIQEEIRRMKGDE